MDANGKKLLFLVDKSKIKNVSTVWVFRKRFDVVGVWKTFRRYGYVPKGFVVMGFENVSTSWVSIRMSQLFEKRFDVMGISKTQTVETFLRRFGLLGVRCGTHTVETFLKRFDGMGVANVSTSWVLICKIVVFGQWHFQIKLLFSDIRRQEKRFYVMGICKKVSTSWVLQKRFDVMGFSNTQTVETFSENPRRRNVLAVWKMQL